jgi:multiple sugar transport system ATP-binding protein
MASISLRDVTKVFERRVTAVCHLSLEAGEGEFLVIVGPSGCGKTTVLRLLAGLEQPTAGQIRLGGRIVNELPPRGRDVAMVFQDGALYPHLSVYENLAFPLRMRKEPEAEVKRRVGEALETLDLASLAGRKPAALSGGQRQRVALGRALVRRPAAFLFDEPLSSLDAALRLALRAEIKALHQRFRTTTLYVTHDQSEAMALGERICVLREGCGQQVGTPSDIYERPANRFVAGFFGTPPMNFLVGRVQLAGETVSLDLDGRSIRVPRFRPGPLTEYRDRMVVAGIRPHDVSLTPLPGQEGNVLSGRVSLLEHFGSRIDVQVALSSGQTCVVSAPPHVQVSMGDEILVYVNPDKVHLFEPDDPGRSIPADAG